MNNATLFRERWSRVIDAAVAAAARGQRRLAADAAAPLTRVTSVRATSAMSAPYALVTPMAIGAKTISISHPAETWELPRQFIHRFPTLKHFAPAKHDLVSAVSERKGLIFDVGRDLGFYGYLSADKGAAVRFFNRSSMMRQHISNTIINNRIDQVSVIDSVFDDKREICG